MKSFFFEIALKRKTEINIFLFSKQVKGVKRRLKEV
jgi:hypothetical protein